MQQTMVNEGRYPRTRRDAKPVRQFFPMTINCATSMTWKTNSGIASIQGIHILVSSLHAMTTLACGCQDPNFCHSFNLLLKGYENSTRFLDSSRSSELAVVAYQPGHAFPNIVDTSRQLPEDIMLVYVATYLKIDAINHTLASTVD